MQKLSQNNILRNRIKKAEDIKKYIQKYDLNENNFKTNQMIFTTSIIILLVVFFLSLYITKKVQMRKLLQDYEITLIIKNRGESNIISNDYTRMPDQIIINSFPQTDINNRYNFHLLVYLLLNRRHLRSQDQLQKSFSILLL